MSSSPRRADHRSGQGCASEKAEDKDQGCANHSRSSFSMQRANDDTAIFVFIGDRRNEEKCNRQLDVSGSLQAAVNATLRELAQSYAQVLTIPEALECRIFLTKPFLGAAAADAPLDEEMLLRGARPADAILAPQEGRRSLSACRTSLSARFAPEVWSARGPGGLAGWRRLVGGIAFCRIPADRRSAREHADRRDGRSGADSGRGAPRPKCGRRGDANRAKPGRKGGHWRCDWR